MFDIGFTEMMLIGIVALVVIGPERLPGVARTAGKYFGRLKRFVTTVKADVEQELRADELREILAKQQRELDTLKDSIGESGREIEKELSDGFDETSEAPEGENRIAQDDPTSGALDDAPDSDAASDAPEPSSVAPEVGETAASESASAKTESNTRESAAEQATAEPPPKAVKKTAKKAARKSAKKTTVKKAKKTAKSSAQPDSIPPPEATADEAAAREAKT